MLIVIILAMREPSRFDPTTTTDMNESRAPKFKSVRKMFGDDEVCYIMDAKNTGNIGRYLNVSRCLIINVFVIINVLCF